MKRKNEDFVKPNLLIRLLQVIWRWLSWLLQRVGSLIGWILKQPFHFLYYLLNGRIPAFENSRQAEAFWRVKRRYRRRWFLMLHDIVFIMACLLAVIVAGLQFYTIQTLTILPEELQWYWYHFRNDLLRGGLVLVVWLVILIIHATVVRSAQHEDDELERVMEREYERIEYEREAPHNYSRLVEQYDESNFEVDSVEAKRNYSTKS